MAAMQFGVLCVVCVWCWYLTLGVLYRVRCMILRSCPGSNLLISNGCRDVTGSRPARAIIWEAGVFSYILIEVMFP